MREANKLLREFGLKKLDRKWLESGLAKLLKLPGWRSDIQKTRPKVQLFPVVFASRSILPI